MNSLFSSFELENIKLHINSLGNQSDREKYKQVIKKHFADKLDLLDESTKLTFEKNPLRLLDSKNESIREACSNLPNLYESINNQSQSILMNLLKNSII